MPNDAKDGEQPNDVSFSAARGRALWPGWVTRIVVSLCAMAAVLVRIKSPDMDSAVVNILTLILAFIGFMTLLSWFVFRSGYHVLLRLLVPISLAGLVAVFAACVRIEHTRGDLIPVFRLKWSKKADELLDKPQVAVAAIDLATTSAIDFPQFLGPRRNMRLEGVNLSRDWSVPPKQLWKQPIGAGWSAFAAVNGFAVTMEQRGDEELVTCYDARTGNLQWSHAVKTRHESVLGGVGPRSTPTIHEGKVYALGATGVLRCLDGASGEQVWRQDLFELIRTTQARDESVVAWGRANSPLIVDQLVVVPAGGPPGGPHVSLMAFDKDTGSKVWQAGNQQVSYSSPNLATLAGIRQIVIVNESHVTGHDPANGQPLWEHKWDGNSAATASASQAVILDDDRVLLSKAYGGGAALLRLQDEGGKLAAKELWYNQRVLKTKFTNVVVYDAHVYALSDGILECVELKSGRAKWKRGRYEHGQILGVDDLLLVLAESGELVLVEANPATHKELGKFQALAGKTWNNLCLYGRWLLVRNGEQAACYELP